MKNFLLNSIISFSFALLVVSVITFIFKIPQDVNIHNVKIVQVNDMISQSMNIKDKVQIQKTVNNTNYLNSWKLSATILGKNSFAMVLKDKKSKVLRLNDMLEGYSVKKIEKEKVLFTTTTDDIWLYTKTKQVNTNNPGINKVLPPSTAFILSKNSFKKNIQNPERLLSTVNIIPDIQSGRFEGMKVEYIQEGSFLYVYGLRKGDVIKKINNKKLLSIADGITAYQNIASSNRFSISVLRDNKIKEIRYEVH